MKPPFAPREWVAKVSTQVLMAQGTYRIGLDVPELATAIRPGQFVMLRPAEGTDPLLGRAFALYEIAHGSDGPRLDVAYAVHGRGTQALSRLHTGDPVRVIGPLGNGFGEPPESGPVVCVAGGIGQTPFLSLAKWWRGAAEYGGIRYPAREDLKFTLIYGVRTASLLAGVADFEAAGVQVAIAAEDGSAGRRGLVTDVMDQDWDIAPQEALLSSTEAPPRPGRIVACGPPGMLRAVGTRATAAGIPCDLALENAMACGFGACFSCVTPILMDDGSIDLRRVCVDGPVFPASRVVWD